MTPPPSGPLELFQKFIRFGALTRPLVYLVQRQTKIAKVLGNLCKLLAMSTTVYLVYPTFRAGSRFKFICGCSPSFLRARCWILQLCRFEILFSKSAHFACNAMKFFIEKVLYDTLSRQA